LLLLLLLLSNTNQTTKSAVLLLLQAMLDGKERTTQQWHELMGQAGFTIKSITQAPNMAAIVAVPSGPN
jgi:hypothetical protein